MALIPSGCKEAKWGVYPDKSRGGTFILTGQRIKNTFYKPKIPLSKSDILGELQHRFNIIVVHDSPYEF